MHTDWQADQSELYFPVYIYICLEKVIAMRVLIHCVKEDAGLAVTLA